MNIAINYNPDPVSGWIKVIADGKDYFVSASSPLYAKAFDAFKAKDWESFIYAVDPAVKIKSLFAKYETVEVKDGLLYVDGDVVDSVVSERLIQMLSNEVDVLPVLKFVYRLRLNPSSRAVNELYTFLEHKCLPLTESGTFLAYKAVRPNYHDKHSGKFDNSVGNVLSMPRNKVDDNKDAGCSYGFHAGTLEYASGFASQNDKIVLVEIDPADVVSIPVDCNFQKLRTCRYKVVEEFERPLTESLYESRFETENDDEVDDYWDDDSDSEICSECREQSYGNCSECDCCEGCCDCQESEGGCMSDWDEPRTEVQLTLNLDNKMTSNWDTERFQYLVMLSWLYCHRRPAVGNALKSFYKDVDDHHLIIPEFSVLRKFTSDEDAHKIYLEYTNSK
jgi:hypothetical protein